MPCPDHPLNDPLGYDVAWHTTPIFMDGEWYVRCIDCDYLELW